ncbi:HNH endonuclease [Halorubrum sp. SD612]|uniref:HNH endonuclease n=1 Tax=Halorubrum sp. SD612 TaxID=1855863 RepID=UPI000A2DA6A3|nr:HNH endonuclease [Halorubrum sp. SD612]OTF07708.1 hypothetical protein B9G38_10095 [Halorubrum sp. SD612]
MAASSYPDDWDERRRKVYSRDNYTCQQCGARGGSSGDTELHAHHLTPRSEGGSDSLDNLQTLCVNCHNSQHKHDITRDTTQNDQQDTVNNHLSRVLSFERCRVDTIWPEIGGKDVLRGVYGIGRTGE